MNVTNPTAVIGERRSDVMQSAVVAKNSFGGAVAPDLAALRTGNALAAAGHALPKTLPPMSPSQQAKATAADTLEQTKKSSERGGKNGQKSGER